MMPNPQDLNPLASLIFETRSQKPRTRGVTMMVDWGLPPGYQADLLTTVAQYVDLAKIAVGLGALYPFDVLTNKLENYRDYQITPFPGGMFLEHAVLHEKTDDYLQAVVDAGFDCLEVSDNLLEIELDQKCELIQRARERYKLSVLGEVGKKEGLVSKVDLAEDADRCLQAGAQAVFLEAADFFSAEVNEAAVQRIIDRCGIEPLIFELPGPWIKGVTLSRVNEIARWLLNRFGPDVNIANVLPSDVLHLEALRLKIGVNAGAS